MDDVRLQRSDLLEFHLSPELPDHLGLREIQIAGDAGVR